MVQAFDHPKGYGSAARVRASAAPRRRDQPFRRRRKAGAAADTVPARPVHMRSAHPGPRPARLPVVRVVHRRSDLDGGMARAPGLIGTAVTALRGTLSLCGGAEFPLPARSGNADRRTGRRREPRCGHVPPHGFSMSRSAAARSRGLCPVSTEGRSGHGNAVRRSAIPLVTVYRLIGEPARARGCPRPLRLARADQCPVGADASAVSGPVSPGWAAGVASGPWSLSSASFFSGRTKARTRPRANTGTR